VRLADFRYLADENIHYEVVARLRSTGLDVQTVSEATLKGAADTEILVHCFRQHQVVLTHDADFGRLAVAAGHPIMGIVYLRPGHILPSFTVQTLQSLFGQALVVRPPFLIVAERREREVKIRIRQW